VHHREPSCIEARAIVERSPGALAARWSTVHGVPQQKFTQVADTACHTSLAPGPTIAFQPAFVVAPDDKE
jgi:hypothetical protein